ncbi:hypothetical protein E4U52_006972 [Claviceps spartinae]|nr:hypothetical protein E4U52_006972 [Claviceps spartinae]
MDNGFKLWLVSESDTYDPGDGGRPSRCHAAHSLRPPPHNSPHEDYTYSTGRHPSSAAGASPLKTEQTGDRLRRPPPTPMMDIRPGQSRRLGPETPRALFRSGEDANAFLDYLDTRYADNTTVAVATAMMLHQLRQRPTEPFTEFLVRFEAQLAKADRLGIDDRDKIELLQMALHTEFDKRCRTTAIP